MPTCLVFEIWNEEKVVEQKGSIVPTTMGFDAESNERNTSGPT
jgi:hypothetical protein